MREIKFRAWDGSKMLQGQDMMNKTVGQLQTWSDRVMQFTGLNDKNGKEIYEGDIVKGIVAYPQLLTGDTDENSNVKMCGSIFYDHSGFSMKVIQSASDGDREGLVNYFSFVGDDGEIFREIEIVGNIYENGELLA
jgi:uncharacterized phage protein (TIGR01671 family)